MDKNIPDMNSESTTPNGFSMPRDYFADSSGSILNKLGWLEEHKVYPFLSALQKEAGFYVLDQYFEHQRIQMELLPYPHLATRFGEASGFLTPPHYLETATVIYPHLDGLSKANVFAVPDAYFEQSAEGLKPREARVIGLWTRRISYSIAALLVLALGIWLFQSLSVAKAGKEDCGTLACIDKKDILESNDLQSVDEEHLYDLVNVKTLEKKLKEEDLKNTKSTTTDSVFLDAADDVMDDL